MTEFKVGDKVSWNGLVGIVAQLDSKIENHPIVVMFNTTPLRTHAFTNDGKLYSDMTEPCLKLIERPKKKVKKTIEAWVNVYPRAILSSFLSEEAAELCADEDRIACVKLTGEYEVEVDE